jgi:hypothetical protein
MTLCSYCRLRSPLVSQSIEDRSGGWWFFYSPGAALIFTQMPLSRCILFFGISVCRIKSEAEPLRTTVYSVHGSFPHEQMWNFWHFSNVIPNCSVHRFIPFLQMVYRVCGTFRALSTVLNPYDTFGILQIHPAILCRWWNIICTLDCPFVGSDVSLSSLYRITTGDLTPKSFAFCENKSDHRSVPLLTMGHWCFKILLRRFLFQNSLYIDRSFVSGLRPFYSLRFGKTASESDPNQCPADFGVWKTARFCLSLTFSLFGTFSSENDFVLSTSDCPFLLGSVDDLPLCREMSAYSHESSIWKVVFL